MDTFCKLIPLHLDLEHLQTFMLSITPLQTKVPESDLEKASNSYLMSLLAMFVGMPIPILNLVATLIFFFGNRKASNFVRWHCTQALVTQISLFAFNTISFWWTIGIFTGEFNLSNIYFAYLIFVLLINLVEIIQTIISATNIRKGKSVRWFFYGGLVNFILKTNDHGQID